MANKLLSICIPTYNRASDLFKNLLLLQNIIESSGVKNDVEVLVSDNASTDGTEGVLKEFKSSTGIEFDYIIQKENTGAEMNQLLVGKMSKSDYILLLGDDDYLDSNYINKVLENLRANTDISCIIPNYYGVSSSGEFLSNREPFAKQQLFHKGFESCLKNSWKAHQLSGLVFRKNNVYEEYLKRGLHNLYPQIFLIAYSCLNGDCLYLPQYPTRVTFIPQIKKDWSYGGNGLMGDIFDNYIKLDLSKREIAILEKDFIRRNPSRIAISTSLRRILKSVFLVISNKNTLLAVKLFCLWFYPLYLFRCLIDRILRPMA